MTSAEEEYEPRIVAITELAAYGKTESVPVETSTAIPVGWSQQDPATEYVHTRSCCPPGGADWQPRCRSSTMAA